MLWVQLQCSHFLKVCSVIKFSIHIKGVEFHGTDNIPNLRKMCDLLSGENSLHYSSVEH